MRQTIPRSIRGLLTSLAVGAIAVGPLAISSVKAAAPNFGSFVIVSTNPHSTSLSPLAKVGDTVTVSFTASEVLSSDPIVSLGGQPMTELSSNSTTLSYTYNRLLNGTEISGTDSPIEIQTSATDPGISDVGVNLDYAIPTAPVVSFPSAAVVTLATTYPLIGTAVAGSLVDVYQYGGTVPVASEQLTSNQTDFSLNVPLVTSTVNVLRVTATDYAGNVSTFTAVPSITSNAIISTTLSSNNIIPTLAKKGDTVTAVVTLNEATTVPTVMIGGAPMTCVAGLGLTYTCTRQLDGTETSGMTTPVVISASDGLTTWTASSTFDVDFTAPSAPVITVPSAQVSTNALTYTITGTAEAGALVTVYNGTTIVGTPEQLGVAATTFAIAIPLTANQQYAGLTVTATDAAGNQSVAATVPTITNDSIAPVISSVYLSSNNPVSGLATKGNQVTVSFTVNKALGATPVVMIGGQPMSQSSVSDMTYTFTRTLTGTETESVTSPITISVTDLAGNVTTGQTSFDIDFTSPAAPTVTGPTAAVSVTGSTYTITGTAAAGSLVRVYEGTTLVAWQQLGATATEYAITVPLNAGADNSFTVTATNQAGNVSAVTPVATVTQIAAAPVVVVPQATTTPAPVASPTPTPTSTASPTPSASPEAGQVAGAATTNSHNYTPWIILAILIALAILATAGYFYWFGGEITEEVAPTPVPPVTTPPSVMSSTTKTTTTKTGPPTTQAPPPKDNSQPEPPKKDKEKRW